MAKRFTDTNKYKKPFIRGLQGAYKLLWDFLYHDCDHAGIWIVDFEIAQSYIGKDMSVNHSDAIKFFNSDEVRIIEIDGGKKWFIPSFIEFQYGQLTEKNRAHASVITILLKHQLIDPSFKINLNKPLITPLQGGKEKDKDKEVVKEQDKEKGEFEIFEDWIGWGKLIVDGLDHKWDAIRGRKVSQSEMDAFLSVATRNKWEMNTQGEFRISLNGFKPNGQVNGKEKGKRDLTNL